MSTDLYIHAMKNVTVRDLECFFANSLGSRYFNLSNRCSDYLDCVHYDTVMTSPQVWIGEVSWLKAMISGDTNYIPTSVELVHDLVGESLPVLDGELAGKILTAACTEDARNTSYDTITAHYAGELEKFLADHMGYRLFTVSW